MVVAKGKGERRLVLFGREFAGGVFLILVCVGGLVGAWPLTFGELSGVGPGLMPKVTAVLVGCIGLLLVAQALAVRGEPLEAWSWRASILVLGAICLFAATIRPLGLAFAGPAAMLLASMADPTTRWREIVPFAIVLPALSIALFKYALRLPIPLAPPLLGY